MQLDRKRKKTFWIAGAVLLCVLALLQLFVVMPIARKAREVSGYGTPEENYAALRGNPNDVGAYRGLADYYLPRRNYPEAIKAL